MVISGVSLLVLCTIAYKCCYDGRPAVENFPRRWRRPQSRSRPGLTGAGHTHSALRNTYSIVDSMQGRLEKAVRVVASKVQWRRSQASSTLGAAPHLVTHSIAAG